MGFLDLVENAISKGRHAFRAGRAILLMKEAERLSREGRHPEAAEILEAYLGLGPGDYSSAEKVGRSLRDLRELNPNVALVFALQLAIMLGMAERSGDELSLRETLLGVYPADYADRSRLHGRLASRPADIEQELWGMQVYMLAAALGKLSRRVEAISVVEVVLGIGQEDYAAPGLIRDKVQALLGSASGELRVGFLMLPALAAQYLGRRAEAAALLEACLGLSPEDYGDPVRLGARLREGASEGSPNLVLYPVLVLLCLLILLRREEDAASLLIADMGLDSAGEVEPREVIDRFRKRAQDMSPELSGFYLLNVAFVMARAGHPRAGVAILAADTELETLDWRDTPRLSTLLAQRLAPLFSSARSAYVLAFAEALIRAGREDRAAFLVDAYLRGGVLDEGDTPFMAYTFSVVAADWLGWWGKDASRSPVEICHALIRFLRDSLAEQGATLRDREDFIRAVSELRRRIVQIGVYWAAQERDSESAGMLRRIVFLWDLELTQRLVVERLLLTEVRPVPAGSLPGEGVWPLTDPPPAAESYLPDFLEVPAMAGILEGMSTPQSPSSPEQAPAPFPFASRFEDLAHRGLDEGGVAGSLGPNGLLLRVTFDPEGRLVWGALRGDGPRLDLAGFGSGAPGDLQRLRWATARHDFAMGLSHWMTRMRRAPALRAAAIQALLASLRALVESAEPGARVAEVMETLAGRFPERVSASILRLFRILTWPLTAEGRDPIAVGELRAAESFVAGIGQQPGGRDALNSLTADYLHQVAGIWDLSSLDASLTPDTDLVVQVDDALHAVPVAWLPRGGEPLYRRVRTVRASLAPQLDALLEEIDRDGSGGPDGRRLLSVSYFGPEDPAREGARWLHHGHLRLAERFGGVSVAGADEETGTVGSIRAALEEHRSFATAAICGHGAFEEAGILLGGEGGEEVLWRGQGCDLARVDWLLLVSCSIGRASRTGDLDVEGFCVQLAVHRARSVLACRWPVLAVEAAAFANEAVRQYLELEGQPERRARALAAARRAVCEGERPLVGLNTAAAFELYGLG